MKRTCCAPECVKPAHRRGLCAMHHKRAIRAGTLPPLPTLEERFWAKVRETNSCWEWLGARNEFGYGTFNIDARPRRAHRVAYELLVGLIPDGLVIDHLCRNTGCVNPAHLEPVTQSINVRRGRSAEATRAYHAAKRRAT